MVSIASVVAVLGFLVPVFAWLLVRARKDRELWAIGIDIPVAVAIDLFVVLTLSRFMSLEVATIVSRAAYLVGTSAVLVWRRRHDKPMPAWFNAIGKREIVLFATATLIAVLLSMQISRTYSIWDRFWHIPLVSSLRGQAIPFKNTFDSRQILHYHFSGDVHAAMLQTLSFSVLHASLALSLAHDVYFGLTGLTLALFLAWWGYRRIGAYALASLVLLTNGPMTFLREGDRSSHEGYSVIAFLSLSFRPHVGLAALLLLGVLGAIIVRLREREDLDWRRTAPAICVLAAALAITDETSLGVIGLSLGLTWLFAPEIVHPRRLVGIGMFAALLVLFILPNLAFAAALSPGGQTHVFKLVPWRSPGCYTPLLPLTDPRGRLLLVYDVLPPVAIGAGAVLHYLHRRSRGRAVLVAFLTILLGVSLFALTRIDVDKSALESHRFVMAAFFLSPVIGLYLLAEQDPSAAPPNRASPYASVLIGAGMALAGVSTIDWMYGLLTKKGGKHDQYYAAINHYTTNCRTEVGDTLGARTRLAYLSKPIWYLYAGCRPTIAPGVPAYSSWALTIGIPLFEKDALAAIRKQAPTGASIPAVCPVEAATPADPICKAASANGTCHELGPRIKECMLTAAEAAALAP